MDIALGPQIQALLDLPTPYYSSLLEGESAYEGLGEEIASRLSTVRELNCEDFASFLEELLGLDFPEQGLVFFSEKQGIVSDWDKDFRILLAAGNLAMLSGKLPLARDLMMTALKTEPLEIAPYANLAEIYLQQNEPEKALKMALDGIQLEKNHKPFWFFMRRYAAKVEGEDLADEWVLAQGQKIGSWVGVALSSYHLYQEEVEKRSSLLFELFSEGERSPDFICELSAALGLAQEYDKIEMVTWGFKQNQDAKTPVPWQIEAHHAQALVALNRPLEALPLLREVLAKDDLPAEARHTLSELVREAQA